MERIGLRQKDTLAAGVVRAGISSDDEFAIRTWLVKQLIAHEYAKLGQGGHKNTQIPLREVFVDLPTNSTPSGGAEEGEDRAPFLQKLLLTRPIDLKAAFSSKAAMQIGLMKDRGRENVEVPSIGRWKSKNNGLLLIGGPGQGKSTLGQLACQLHRALLLEPYLKQCATPQQEVIRALLSEIKSSSNEHGFAMLRTPLFPLQVVLPDFSGWMAKQPADTVSGVPIIIRFLADLPSSKNSKMSAEALWALTTKVDSLIVLDGFDEVGATEDRARVVDAARHLLTELSSYGVKSLVLATTRPQGYADELDHMGLRLKKQYLVPLEKNEALSYATKLVEAKMQSPDERAQILSRLQEAANEPATRRLLTTPLQITILTALVQHHGRAPKERWNLFHKYFSYTYDREIERNTYASGLLRDYRNHIERIHARVALLLQVDAERAGGASARMSRPRLEEVISAVLVEEEVSESNRKELVGEIASAAELRLVFLVEPEPGKFGFDIRSLQEFMAAWAITSGRDAEVEARLAQIAKASMFRNVALFAASRLFSEGSPLRDALSAICKELDEKASDEMTRITRVGSLLALEILEEGAVISQPKRARALMDRAIGLLELPLWQESVRLARVANADTEAILAEAVEISLKGTSSSKEQAISPSWVCMADAINREEKWALDLGARVWSQSEEHDRAIRTCVQARIPIGDWFLSRIEANPELFEPHTFIHALLLPSSGDVTGGDWARWLIQANHVANSRSRRENSLVNLVVREKGEEPAPQPTYTQPKTWQVWISIYEYEGNPSAKSLAKALRDIAEFLPTTIWESVRWNTSWPLASCLAAADTQNALAEYSMLAESGLLGDTDEWRACEKKWTSDIRLLDIVKSASQLPWTLSALQKCPPFCGIAPWRLAELTLARESKKESEESHSIAKAIFDTTVSRQVRQQAADICLATVRYLGANSMVSEQEVMKWIRASPESIDRLIPKPRILSKEAWISMLDQCHGSFSSWRTSFSQVMTALTASAGHPALVKLLVQVMEYGVGGSVHSRLTDQEKEQLAKFLNTHNTSSIAKAELSLLRFFLGDVSVAEEKETLAEIESASIESPQLWLSLLGFLLEGPYPTAQINRVAIAILKTIGTDNIYSSYALKQVRDKLHKQKSDLESLSTWNRLGLPLPYPTAPTQGDFDGGIPQSSVRIKSLVLKDVRGFKDLDLQFTVPENDSGQWVVILGPNGIGKTTILRSLALSLRNVSNPAIWPRGAFSGPWQRVASEGLVESSSSIYVRLGDDVDRRTLIRQSTSSSFTQIPEIPATSLVPLFAYGCRRGSALGGMTRQVNVGTDDGPEVATLFDEGSDLIHAETWLIQLEGDSQKDPTSKSLYASVVNAIKELLELSDLQVVSQKVVVSVGSGPHLPFSSLSDGYLTSAGWFLDLVARWVALLSRSYQPIDHDFLANMRGLVLIDEIDLHLHPRWQIEIISRTRKILPKMSFIVTSHNPLTLVGAKADEILVLSYSDDGVAVAEKGVETPLLLTGGQLYRRYFGIEDIYPHALGRSLERFAFLSSYARRTPEEDLELSAIRAELEVAGVKPSWDEVSVDDSSLEDRSIDS